MSAVPTTSNQARADAALLDLAKAVRDAGYRFVTPTPATHQRVNSRPGNHRARTLPDIFGWSRPFESGVLPPSMFDLMRKAGVVAAHAEGWKSLVRMSTLSGELFIHSAFPTLAEDAVFFGPDTYRFATAVTSHLGRMKAPLRRAVDIGCGAGPGGILVAKMRPEADVLLLDINDAALRFAGINAALAGIGNTEPCRSDLLSQVDGSFDLIVSNPPYLVDASKRAYRHGGGRLGSQLSSAILDVALERLSPQGSLVLYTGSAIVGGFDEFRSESEKKLEGTPHAWSYVELDPDVFGEELETPPYDSADRIAAVVLSVVKKV